MHPFMHCLALLSVAYTINKNVLDYSLYFSYRSILNNFFQFIMEEFWRTK